ncbi:hypothetical protein NE237_003698 [Protea cynaroides]|uniref:DC1 domain-containing protein n=1 Tax=Protea cynaroides TaxID=273540 RepID=A0A9Q0KHZ9_9MAGN|nr:hypothetical protein NE237_003698 [Protea cynaroides]
MKLHFSHPHPLTPYEALEHEQIQCSGCELSVSGLLYGCNQCKYFLHEQCRNIGRWMSHPSHTKHDLTLLPKPTYPQGLFWCNGCGSSGQSFSLSCARCKFDLHIQCALLPHTIVHKDHPKHPLTLFFEFPFDDSKIFWCDVCNLIVEKGSWIYYCQECDYGTHLSCAVSEIGETSNKPSKHLMQLTGKQTEIQPVPNQTVGQGELSRKDEEHRLKQVVEQIMDTELEIMTLQNQLIHQTSKLMNWVYRR